MAYFDDRDRRVDPVRPPFHHRVRSGEGSSIGVLVAIGALLLLGLMFFVGSGPDRDATRAPPATQTAPQAPAPRAPPTTTAPVPGPATNPN